jgi:hypothetical protein
VNAVLLIDRWTDIHSSEIHNRVQNAYIKISKVSYGLSKVRNYVGLISLKLKLSDNF